MKGGAKKGAEFFSQQEGPFHATESQELNPYRIAEFADALKRRSCPVLCSGVSAPTAKHDLSRLKQKSFRA